MHFQYDCIHCNIRQTRNIANQLHLTEEQTEIAIRKVLAMLSTADYSKTNPEIMSKTWDIACEASINKDPYKNLRKKFNTQLLEVMDDLREYLVHKEDSFMAFVQAAILGNVIDLGPGHDFEQDDWMKKIIDELKDFEIAIDDSDLLREELDSANSLLYIGDNCGEIVLDRLFIEYLKREYPQLDITYAVRGGAILNDCIMEDAVQIGMEEVVSVIDSGACIPGTVLEKTSKEFKNAFEVADLVIAKGQGNFEGLHKERNEKIYHLLMAKCNLLAGIIDVPVMSKICWKQK